MNSYWRKKLTPFDWELCKMVENLTGFTCEPKNGIDHYFFEADYSRNSDSDYHLAIWDAICGRAGNRLLSIVDVPERHSFLVKLRFSDDVYPEMISMQTFHNPNLEKGYVYYCGDRRTVALQIKSENPARQRGPTGQRKQWQSVAWD